MSSPLKLSQELITSGRSMIKIKNRVGLSIEPLDTPALIQHYLKEWLSKITFFTVFDNFESNHGQKQYNEELRIWKSLSNEIWKATVHASLFLYKSWGILSLITIYTSVVDLEMWKQYHFSGRKVRRFANSELIRASSTLSKKSRRLIRGQFEGSDGSPQFLKTRAKKSFNNVLLKSTNQLGQLIFFN